MSDGGTPNLWVSLDPGLAFRDPSLAEVRAYWEGKRAGRTMPSRADIDPLELKPHLGNLCLVEVHHRPLRLRYRLIGTEITRAMDRDSTGRWFHDLYHPALLADVERSYRWLIEHRRPLRSFGRAFYPDKNFYEYEFVNLPLSSDGETIDMVLGKLVFRLEGE